MLRSQLFLLDWQNTLQQRLGFGVSILGTEQVGHMRQTLDYVGMLRGQDLFPCRQSALIERQGLCILMFRTIQFCQAMQTLYEIGRLRPLLQEQPYLF